MMWKLKRMAPVLLAGSLGACAVGPDFQAPKPQLPDQWQTQVAQSMAHQEQWWQGLHDPQLSALIDAAVAANPDLQTAWSRVRQARAQRGVSAGALYPSLSVGADASRTRSDGITSKRYSAAFDASWEVDLFGANRRALQASEAEVAASIDDLHGVMVSLVSEVALDYVQIRVYQTRIQSAEANLANQEDTLRLAKWKAQAGLATDLEVEQANYSVEQTRAQLPVLQSGLQQMFNSLGLLLGRQPGALRDQLSRPGAIPTVPDRLWVGVPADALRQRPDVRKAEHQLEAQTAQVGVATAALYPSLKLTGSVGVDALTPGGLFNDNNPVSSLVAGLTQPLFNGGALRRALDVQKELLQQAELNYKNTVLGALNEIENTLIAYVQEHQHQQALQRAADSAHKAAQMAHERYQSGLVDFQTVLDTQRSYLSLQDSLDTSNGEIAADMIRLYKALGGGWRSLDPNAAQAVDSTTGAAARERKPQ